MLVILLIGIRPSSALTQSASSDTQEISNQGGALMVQTDDYFVTVDIPAGALPEAITLTLSVKPATKWGPFIRNMIKGISIQPSGVLFYEPVRISACSYSDYELTENDGIFLLETNQLAIPCGDHDVSMDEGMIAGTSYESGNFVIASPSFGEVNQQAERVMEYARRRSGNDLSGTIPQQRHGPCPDIDSPEEGDCMGWQYTQKVVRGMLDYCKRAILAGKTYEEEIWRQEINEFAQKAINDFLKKPVPDEPCGLYLHAAMKYREMELLGLVSSEAADSSPLDKRLTSLFDNCLYRFTLETREWIKRKERRDDDAQVDEELNRHGLYYFSMPIFGLSGTEMFGEKVNGNGSESIFYKKSFVLDKKQRHETKSGERRVTDVKGGVYLKSHGPNYDTLEVEVALYFQHDIKSRAWGSGYGSTGSYDNSSSDNSKSKETKKFVLGNYTKKYGDEKAGWSYTVTFTPPPQPGDKPPRECW